MFPAPAPTTELPPQQNSAPPDGEAAKAKAREIGEATDDRWDEVKAGAEQAAVDRRVLVEMGLGRAALAVEQPAAVAAQGGGARRPVDVLRFRHTCNSRCSRSQGLMTFMNSSCSTSLTSL